MKISTKQNIAFGVMCTGGATLVVTLGLNALQSYNNIFGNGFDMKLMNFGLLGGGGSLFVIGSLVGNRLLHKALNEQEESQDLDCQSGYSSSPGEI